MSEQWKNTGCGRESSQYPGLLTEQMKHSCLHTIFGTVWIELQLLVVFSVSSHTSYRL